MAQRLGFVGLGTMGAPMARHLVANSLDVTVWNRTPEKAEPLREWGAAVAPSLSELARCCDAILLCVNRTEDVRACLAELTKTAAPGTLFIDHSTIAPPETIEIHSDMASRGFRFVDAPITGGSMGAQKGQLTIFLGGDPVDVEEAIEIVGPYTKRAERVGGPGAGQLAKVANQIAVAGALLGLCESMSFAQKAGLDTGQIMSLVGGGAGGSWAFENYGPKILARDWSPGFTITNQRKDIGYCADAARAIDVAIPTADLLDSLLRPLEEEGHGEWATAALFEGMLRLGANDRSP
jgi:3-hydroxyisobutyrate dehydrogenase-like beta-hydroxyacid dehydrogenase